MRFRHNGNLNDLKESIEYHQQALELLPVPHPNRSSSINNLAFALVTQFEQMGDLNDLERSIEYFQQALELTPASHPNQSESFDNLASALHTRFQQKGNLNDLEVSIDYHQQALELRPVPHPNRSSSLNNLANALSSQFQQTGEFSDLDKSIECHQQALRLRPTPHPNQSSSLNNLASALSTRFEEKGDLNDLDESIEYQQQALKLLPHPNQSISLHNLASALLTRFQQKGGFSDLEESIENYQKALNLFPAAHPNRPSSLNNLANALCMRFEEKGDLSDLEESIHYLQQALELCPVPHPNRSSSLNNLANALFTRFEQKGDLNDLEESIQYHQQALELRPASHTNQSISLNNLASALAIQFEQKRDLNDLKQAIASYQNALAVLPADHPKQAFMMNLGSALILLYALDKESDNLEDAMHAFHHTLKSNVIPLRRRFQSARTWSLHADRFHHPSAAEAFQHGINLLPLLASFDLSLHGRHEALVQTQGFSSNACSWAIRSGKLETAVEYLSAARTVFWSQSLRLRTPLDDLEVVDSALATRLRDISSQLEHAAQRSSTRDGFTTTAKEMNKEAKRCRGLAEQWNSILQQVREHPGFEDFLLPATFSKLCQAARNGPVVMLSVNDTECDALLVETDGVKHIPIPDLTLSRVTELCRITQDALASKGIRADLSGRNVVDTVTDLFKAPPEQMSDQNNRKGYQIPDVGRTPEDKFRFVLNTLWSAVSSPIIKILDLHVRMLRYIQYLFDNSL